MKRAANRLKDEPACSNPAQNNAAATNKTRITATRSFSIVLRLPWEVNPLFQDWLARHFPDRAARVMARVREMRGGRDNDPRFGSRMRGEGVWAELLAQRFRKACARLGLDRDRFELDLTQFEPPRLPSGTGQGELF